jgi:hypothetical protein
VDAPSPAFATLPSTPPLAFFEQACASCHGPFGTFYGEAFAATQNDAELTKVVREMVVGPGRSTLDPLSLEALVAFHRSLRDRPNRPFIVVTMATKERLRGEVSPGASVSIVLGGRTLPSVQDGFEWWAELPPGWERSSRMVIRAQGKDPAATSEIDLSSASFSHQK